MHPSTISYHVVYVYIYAWSKALLNHADELLNAMKYVLVPKERAGIDSNLFLYHRRNSTSVKLFCINDYIYLNGIRKIMIYVPLSFKKCIFHLINFKSNYFIYKTVLIRHVSR